MLLRLDLYKIIIYYWTAGLKDCYCKCKTYSISYAETLCSVVGRGFCPAIFYKRSTSVAGLRFRSLTRFSCNFKAMGVRTCTHEFGFVHEYILHTTIR